MKRLIDLFAVLLLLVCGILFALALTVDSQHVVLVIPAFGKVWLLYPPRDGAMGLSRFDGVPGSISTHWLPRGASSPWMPDMHGSISRRFGIEITHARIQLLLDRNGNALSSIATMTTRYGVGSPVPMVSIRLPTWMP